MIIFWFLLPTLINVVGLTIVIIGNVNHNNHLIIAGLAMSGIGLSLAILRFNYVRTHK